MFKVLIADDEPFILDGLRHIIQWEEHGLEIAGEATNGIEALEILKTTKVHILITDIKMPKMNGLELLKRVRELYPEIKSVILSGYDDFVFLKEAIKLEIENYLLKPVLKDELSSTLLNITDKIESELYKQISLREGAGIIRNNLLCRLVSNNISENELAEKSSFLNINLDYKRYAAGIVKILYENTDKGLISFAANNICSELTGIENQGISFCDLNGDVIILFMKDNLERTNIYHIVSECVRNIRKSLNIDVFATIGNLQSDLKNIHISCKIAKELLEYHLILPSNSIVDYEQVEKLTFEREKSISINYELLKLHLAAKDKQVILEFISSIFGQVQRSKGVTPSDLQNIAIEVLFNMNNIVKSLKGNTTAFFESLKVEFSSIYKAKSYGELRSYFESVADKYIDFLCLEEEKSSPVVKQVCNYICQNYSKDISLKLLSNNYNVNTAYLGQQFKKETGELFSDYLNRIRIEKAKELLSTTLLKTNEIAEKVGYIEPNYFYRAFKKFTGLSPSEYRVI